MAQLDNLLKMRRTIYLLLALSIFTSCSAHRSTITNRNAQRNNRQIQRENGPGDYTALTSVQYINKYKDIAIAEMKAYGIPASITLAQGLYESGSGNSELARVANNHFGVKAGNSWTGKVYYKDDDERNDAFRVYGSAEESFRDHSLFLKKKNYASLFQLDITDYKGWARGLKRCGYATNPDYPGLLINVIEKYNLQQYDAPAKLAGDSNRDPMGYATPAPVQPAPVQPVQTTPGVLPAPVDTSDNTAQTSQAPAKTYTVKQGDTLYNISKRFGLSVDDLKSLNNLADNTIKIGQVLTVSK